MVSREHREIRLLPEPVIGFRIWCFNWKLGMGGGKAGAGLWSINPTYGQWQPGINKATCMKLGLGHHPAEPDCGCGFWIKNSFKGASSVRLATVITRSNPTYVLGAAMGWGRVQKHQDGWRCEYATPLALSQAFDRTGDLQHMLSLVKQVCLGFDIPFVDDLQNYPLTNLY